MPDVILYLIKANLAILLFYGGYHLLLRRLTFYNLNRFYLLFAMVFSVCYPLINLNSLWAQHDPLPQQAAIVITNWQQLPETSFSLWPYVQTILFIVAFILGIRMILRLLSLRKVHLNSKRAIWNAYRYLQTEVDVSPFSFWKNIYVYTARHEAHELHGILEHEQVHVDQLHSFDVLMAEVYTIVFWFNPFAWLLRHAIHENVEFITDRQVLRNGLDARLYQYNLLKNITQSQPQLTNSFNFKNLKNRIVMMNKESSSHFHLGKYILLVPVVIVLVSVVTLSRAYQQVDISATEEATVVESEATLKADVLKADTLKVDALEAKPTEEAKAFKFVPADTSKKSIAGIKVRSASGKDPLIIVEGIEVRAKNFMAMVKPEDIESMSIYKDSMAISRYGSRGENGVIEITMKKKGGATTITSSASADSLHNGNTVNVDAPQSLEKVTVLGYRSKPNFKKNIDTQIKEVTDLEKSDIMVFLDGKEIDMATMRLLDANELKSIDVIKGVKGEKSIIRITSKTSKN